MNSFRCALAAFAIIGRMKPYMQKKAPEQKDAKPAAAEDQVEMPELELEDPLPKDVEGFDPYNTGIFKMDKGPWNKDSSR